MRPPTRKSGEPMCEPSSAPSRLRAMRRKSDGVIRQVSGVRGQGSESRRARLKGGPVDALLIGVVGLKDRLESEGELRWPVRVEMGNAAFGFVDTGNVSHRHPPQRRVAAFEFLEPGMALAEQFAVRGLVDVVPKRINVFPDRHIQQCALVSEGAEIRRIALIGLKPPYKTGARVGKGVDLLKPVDESRHDGIVEFSPNAADVDLGDVVVGHPISRGKDMIARWVCALPPLRQKKVARMGHGASVFSAAKTKTRPGWVPAPTSGWGTCEVLLFKFFVEPICEGLEFFVAAEEVADHLAAGPGATLFEHRLAITGAGLAAEQIGGIELGKEVERDDFVEGVGVVVRRISGQMPEAAVHAVAFEPGPRLEALVQLLDDPIEIDAGWILVVQIEREGGVVELGAHAVGAAKRAGALEVLDEFGGQDLAGFVVPGNGLQQFLVAEEFFEHLRWDFDEVAFGGESGEAGPLSVTAENGVHQVAELVKERDHVVVLEKARLTRIPSREIADEGGFRQVAAAYSRDHGRSRKPLVFAFAGVHVEIEPADQLTVLAHFKD